MSNRVTYLISSCKGYEAPLARLLASLPADAHAFVVVGGHERRRPRLSASIAHVEVSHNSYDYTALIEYIEGDWTFFDHLFLLHDTMELGPDAARLIHQAPANAKATAVWGGECNLGLYRADYLHECRAQILGLKNCSKRYAVEMEGFLWRQLPESERASYPGDIAIGEAEQAYAGAERQRVHYAGVDITKWKANWGQTWPPSVVTP